MLFRSGRRSVDSLVRAERSKVCQGWLAQTGFTNDYGSLATAAEHLWFGNALKAHQEGEKCIDLYDMYFIGRQIDCGNHTVQMTASSTHKLLNIGRVYASGWPLQFVFDGTYRTCSAALMVLATGINVVGCQGTVITYSIVPVGCESENAWTESYRATVSAFCAIMDLPACGKQECETCACIEGIRNNTQVARYLRSKQFAERKLTDLAGPICDNSDACQNFTKNVMDIQCRVCQTHLSGSPIVIRHHVASM